MPLTVGQLRRYLSQYPDHTYVLGYWGTFLWHVSNFVVSRHGNAIILDVREHMAGQEFVFPHPEPEDDRD